MAITLSTGTTAAIASTYDSAATFTSASNASECVLSYVSDPGYIVGDILEVSSGWGLLNDRVVRVGAIAGAGPYTVTLEDVDTSSTSDYPAGTGGGTTREITAWTGISQIKGISTSGGDQNFTDVSTIEDVTEREIPTTKSAVKVELEMYDDAALAHYAVVVAAADTSTKTAMRLAFKNGSFLYANAYWSIQKVPSITKNEPLMGKISASYAAEAIRYAS
ncbi:phage tail protein [Candidatus Nitrotoga sp. M5]|uniref:phage tail protein n=1 Tax=Candidatus Nitrotoga sp. M5 TaxID=2890409 RepID=UPI001EF61EF8|nr:phage tail protein [Candidatus Nitrotoga sp. M5]CAH1387020.1 putative phage tail protein [Candidatus Nitrotoga sp. M5]